MKQEFPMDFRMEENTMIKSTERNKEYYVILQPRYREHSPIFMRGWARDKEDAIKGVFNPDLHKEVLDVVEVSNMEITEDIYKKYWTVYGTYNPNRINEVQKF